MLETAVCDNELMTEYLNFYFANDFTSHEFLQNMIVASRRALKKGSVWRYLTASFIIVKIYSVSLSSLPQLPNLIFNKISLGGLQYILKIMLYSIKRVMVQS